MFTNFGIVVWKIRAVISTEHDKVWLRLDSSAKTECLFRRKLQL
jgi:hypothetical protein